MLPYPLPQQVAMPESALAYSQSSMGSPNSSCCAAHSATACSNVALRAQILFSVVCCAASVICVSGSSQCVTGACASAPPPEPSHSFEKPALPPLRHTREPHVLSVVEQHDTACSSYSNAQYAVPMSHWNPTWVFPSRPPVPHVSMAIQPLCGGGGDGGGGVGGGLGGGLGGGGSGGGGDGVGGFGGADGGLAGHRHVTWGTLSQ